MNSHGTIDAQSIEALVSAFSEAAAVTFQEWAATEVAVQAVDRASLPEADGELTAVLTFESGLSGFLALSASLETATALARRTFTDVEDDPQPSLVGDWLEEVANIIAGQAKGLLVGTPQHFTFSTPRVGSGPLATGIEDLVLTFGSDLGTVTLRLCLGRPKE